MNFPRKILGLGWIVYNVSVMHFGPYILIYIYAVTIDEIWIRKWFYWTFVTNRDYMLHFTITYKIVSKVTHSLQLPGSGFQLSEG
jgi:hypothetical protein